MPSSGEKFWPEDEPEELHEGESATVQVSQQRLLREYAFLYHRDNRPTPPAPEPEDQTQREDFRHIEAQLKEVAVHDQHRVEENSQLKLMRTYSESSPEVGSAPVSRPSSASATPDSLDDGPSPFGTAPRREMSERDFRRDMGGQGSLWLLLLLSAAVGVSVGLVIIALTMGS